MNPLLKVTSMQVLPFESLVWTEHCKYLAPFFLNYIILLESICMKTINPKELKASVSLFPLCHHLC